MTDLRDLVEQKLENARNTLVENEIEFVQVLANLEGLRTEVKRLEAALAALDGEIVKTDEIRDANADKSSEVTKSHAPAPEQIHNPLANLKCTGCGEVGTLQETVYTTSAGGMVRSLICSDCSNQMIM